MGWFIALVALALAILAFFILAWWGLPIAAVLGLVAGLYIAQSRKTAGPDAGTIERGRRREPTGVPRKSSGGAETANERVGQS
jgi:hypothetical protein